MIQNRKKKLKNIAIEHTDHLCSMTFNVHWSLVVRKLERHIRTHTHITVMWRFEPSSQMLLLLIKQANISNPINAKLNTN